MSFLFHRSHQTTSQPDFSHLPENVWLTILQLVSVKDRYHLSLTCSRLHSLFGVPTVWRSGTLYFGKSYFGKSKQVGQMHLCKMFGHHFQNVILIFDDLSLEPEWLSLLSELSSAWNLKSLVIKIGLADAESIFKRKYEDLLCSLDFNRISQQLTHLEFIVPCLTNMIDDLAYMAFQSISALFGSTVSILPFLRRVRLNCPIVHNKDTDNLSLPASLTSSLLLLVPQLQDLELSAFNFSDNLLHQLAHTFTCKGQLRKLVVDVFAFNCLTELPDLSAEAWTELLLSCPRLQVSCVVRCPVDERLAHLKSLFPQEVEVPLVSITVQKWREQTEKDLWQAIKVARQHPQALHTFVTYYKGLDEELENAVVAVAKECIHLRNLTYLGEIHYRQVMTIASLERKWRCLQFYRGRIVTEDSQRLCHSVDPPILYKWSKTYPDIPMTEGRKVKLEEMSAHVSGCLQCPWEPLTC